MCGCVLHYSNMLVTNCLHTFQNETAGGGAEDVGHQAGLGQRDPTEIHHRWDEMVSDIQ